MSEAVQPDIYEVEFLDIYDVQFDDVAVDPEAEASTDASSLTLETEVDALTAPNSLHLVGQVAVAPVIEATEAIEILPDAVIEVSPTQEYSDVEVKAADETSEDIEVSDELQSAVTQVITDILESSSKAIVPHDQIKDILGNAHGLSRIKLKVLEEAVKRDGRIEYFNDACYLVIDRSDQVMEAYQQGKDPFVDENRIAELITYVLGNIRTNENGFATFSSVLGTIKSRGEYLNPREYDAFFVQLYTAEGVTAQPNGNFSINDRIQKVRVVKPKAEKTLRGTEVRPLGIESKDGRPLTRRQVNKAFSDIDGSDELRQARDRGKRKANTRYHGRNFRKKSGKKSQGKGHGQKKTLDQLIEEMNKAPKQ